jgi:hypothetical protein
MVSALIRHPLHLASHSAMTQIRYEAIQNLIFEKDQLWNTFRTAIPGSNVGGGGGGGIKMLKHEK